MARFAEVTGLILAGGLSRRMDGRPKPFLTFEGRRFIDLLVELFGSLFGQTVIVTNQPTRFADLPVRIVRDLEPDRGAIMGLLTGLYYSTTDWNFVSACDVPLLQAEFVAAILQAVEPGYGVVLPRTPEGLQPLTAAYHRRCLPHLIRLLQQEQLAIRHLYRRVPVRYLEPTELGLADPRGLSLINVNTPADLDRIRVLEETAPSTFKHKNERTPCH